MSFISRVTYADGITLVTLPHVPGESGIVGGILSAIAQKGINVDMISQTAPHGGNISVAFSIADSNTGALLPVIGSFKPEHPGLRCDVSPGMSKVCFYDERMVETPGVAAKLLTLMAGAGVESIMITTSDVDVSILVREHDLAGVIELARREFGVEPTEASFS